MCRLHVNYWQYCSFAYKMFRSFLHSLAYHNFLQPLQAFHQHFCWVHSSIVLDVFVWVAGLPHLLQVVLPLRRPQHCKHPHVRIQWKFAYYFNFQAPSLLITLINMFLEIASAPKVPYPGDPTNSENEYSVFGPSQATAAVQVLARACAISQCIGVCWISFPALYSRYSGHRCDHLCPLDALYQTFLPPLQTQEGDEEDGKEVHNHACITVLRI